MIVDFAAIMGIDEEYYEAAKLDGASKLQFSKYGSLKDNKSIPRSPYGPCTRSIASHAVREIRIISCDHSGAYPLL
jgi:hypothetical protein